MWRHSDPGLKSENSHEETQREVLPGTEWLPATVLCELYTEACYINQSIFIVALQSLHVCKKLKTCVHVQGQI